jgi:hypothetical protein
MIFNDEAAALLVPALQSMRQLKKCEFSRNKLTKAGEEMIRSALSPAATLLV